jgi:hypothetical protein
VKQPHGGRRNGQGQGASAGHLKAEERLAREHGVKPRTIRRDGQFAQALEIITANCGKEAAAFFLNPKPPYTREDAVKLARRGPEEQRDLIEKCRRGVVEKPWRQNRDEEETMRVPREVDDLVEALGRLLGRERLEEVYQKLGDCLQQQGGSSQAGDEGNLTRKVDGELDR